MDKKVGGIPVWALSGLGVMAVVLIFLHQKKGQTTKAKAGAAGDPSGATKLVSLSGSSVTNQAFFGGPTPRPKAPPNITTDPTGGTTNTAAGNTDGQAA